MASRPARAAWFRALLPGTAVVTGLVVAAAVLPPSSATADPRPTLAEVQQRLTALEEKAEAAAEERNGIRMQVAETERKTKKVAKRIKAQEKALKAVQRQLGVFAAAAYRSGGMDSTLQLMLSEDPQGFLEQSSSLNAVARGQQSTLRRAAAAQLELDQSRVELEQTRAEQKKAQAAAEEQSRVIEARVAEADRLLASLRQEERERLDRAQARRERQASRASRAAIERTAPVKVRTPSYKGPASGRAAKAVAYARAQVGKRYHWGGSGPNAFDCSGLTMRAWQQAGVSLPHQSGAQHGATRRVSYSEVQPGDLLFFHSPIHHVGIYVGGGIMVHAQNSATGVVASPVSGHWAAKLVGVGRP